MGADDAMSNAMYMSDLELEVKVLRERCAQLSKCVEDSEQANIRLLDRALRVECALEQTRRVVAAERSLWHLTPGSSSSQFFAKLSEILGAP